MHDKILQIIPAPADMWAIYENRKTGAFSRKRVPCLALKADRDGRTYVEALHSVLSYFWSASDRADFYGFEYGMESMSGITSPANDPTYPDSCAEQTKHCVLSSIVKNCSKGIPCLESNCAWYDYEAKSCALLSIARSLREENPRK